MLTKLSETIYYLANQDEQERPTLGLVCGEQYSLVIDVGNSPQHAKEFLQEIAKLQVPPIKYVVLTHAHWDHFLGMNEFDAITIVNRQTSKLLKEWQSYKFDNHSLQTYVNSQQISAKCMEIIQADIPNHDSFQLRTPDIIFEHTLTIDLGNKICVIEQIQSTHTNDSTIVYIPDEKVIFLGDAAYGTTTNGLFRFKQSLLIPMIEDIQKYGAEQFLLGHESICDTAEMDTYWAELIAASQAVISPSLDDAIECFKIENGRKPNDNELFFLQAFVNDHIVQA